MIRKMLSLAVEALKVEAKRWANPSAEAAKGAPPVVAAPMPVAEVKPVAAPARWNTTSAGHMATLASTVCPDGCGAAKKVGNYYCDEHIAEIRARKVAS